MSHPDSTCHLTRKLSSRSQGSGLVVEMDKGDVPIRKEYFQLWYMQGMPYALYDNYAYVTL
jgi:hypothetical protein